MSILWKIIPEKVRACITWPILGALVLFWDAPRNLTFSEVLIVCACMVYFVFISIPLILLCIPLILLCILFSPMWACLSIALEEAQTSAALDTPSPPLRPQRVSSPLPEVLLPSFVTTSSAPPPLRLQTPYTVDTVTLTVHTYKKRRSFSPIPNRFDPPSRYAILSPLNPQKHFEPHIFNTVKMWFIEFTCTLENAPDDTTSVWGQLEEVLPDTTTPRQPLLLRQFLPLTNDEAEDVFAGSTLTLTHAKHSFEIQGTLENTLFFKLDERMRLRTMAFSLQISSTKGGPYQASQPLFTIEV